MRAMESSSRVTKDKEQVASKVEQIKGSHPLGSGGKDQPSNSIQKKSWYRMVMQDPQEKETIRGSQSSGSGGKDQPSNSIQKKSWYEMAMQDAQEKEASRSIFRGKPSQTGLREMVGIAFMSEGATNQVDW
jgi:hypothetical protein